MFLWLEFRFKSFLKLNVHFKCFMCIHMRKLHAECQIPADEQGWCQIVFSFDVPKFIPKYSMTKTWSQFLGWSVRTLAQYIIKSVCHSTKQNYAQTSVCTFAISIETPANKVKLLFFIIFLIFLLVFGASNQDLDDTPANDQQQTSVMS